MHNLDALSVVQRQRHASLVSLLRRAVRSVDNTADGFSLSFPRRGSTWMLLAELIDLEGRCFPELDFVLDHAADNAHVRVGVSGQAASVAALRQRWLPSS